MQLQHSRTDIQVRFSDLDLLGHVSNSYYAQYFDLARVTFFRQIAKLIKNPVPSYVVASVKMDMLREIRFDDRVVVDTWCSRVGTKSMTIEHVIYANGEKATTCQTVLVGFDRDTRSSTALPTDWEVSDLSDVIPPSKA
ncbi:MULTISPECIES: acyl-CoA thioesterase [Zhongshania]|jgi:acyl-CoA thioester hydrolase|uniref:Acyl-CoA thioester hydrolase n=1 Tax=Zhongshania antarctica TaxID=641702 RepID=A0A840R6N8_9GAMM|nr:MULTISPECIES: thioesterase family protein [Zhongshania]MBB5188527.1 acyl-CoA thioester hydrolase [Zhongshania antarctica]